MYVISIITIVVSNTLYHICSKSTPEKVNPFSSLFITYLTGAIITAVFHFYRTDKGFFNHLEI